MKTDRNPASWGNERRAEIDARAIIDSAIAERQERLEVINERLRKIRRAAEATRIASVCLVALVVIIAIASAFPSLGLQP